MINIILAIDSNNGLGKDCKLPWKIPEDLHIFKEKTVDSIVICGRVTAESLPYLQNRTVFCISRNFKSLKSNKNIIFMFKTVKDAYEEALLQNKKIFIVGGKQIYDYVFDNFDKNQMKIHISFIKNTYNCDTVFNINNLQNFYINSETVYDNFKHCEMEYKKLGEYQYLVLLKDILKNGERRATRNSETISEFCKHLKFDLRESFPLLTTKKMFTKGIIEELLFFIRGDIDTKSLEEKGINIWKGNTSREFLDTNGFKDRKDGEMGPMYGSIWRHFNSLSDEKEKEVLKDSRKCEILYKSYNKDGNSYSMDTVSSIKFGIDQLQNVINEIKTNPSSRRILLTTYNPAQVHLGVLYPCHSIIIQFYVQEGFLDMFCYNRSSDAFLGLPFNIASSSLLLMVIAKLTNLTARYFNLSLGDVHVYSNHEEQVLEQINRIPYIFPNIELPEFETLEDVEKLTYKEFKIIDYKSHESIKAQMVA